MKRRFIAIVLVLVCLLAGVLVPNEATAKGNDSIEHATGALPIMVNGKRASVEQQLKLTGATLCKGKQESFPAKYDLRDYGYVTPVKYQGRYGLCWVFAACSAMESNALVRGYGEYNLSEYQLGYFSSHIVEGQDETIKDDGLVINTPGEWYDFGGNSDWLVPTLMKGYGPVSEETCPYEKIEEELTVADIRNKNVLQFQKLYAVKANDISGIKRLITKNGALVASVAADSWDDNDNYYNDTTNAAYYPEYEDGEEGINHTVTIVGWDDNFSKNNFIRKPKKDGAWIVKNSWGTWWGDDGYCYISYYDVAFDVDSLMYSFTVLPGDTYDSVYQYDGGMGINGHILTGVAMTINAKENQTITGIRIYPKYYGGSERYYPLNATIKIYANNKAKRIENNKCIYEEDVFITEAGYQSIELSQGVNIHKGGKYWVTVCFDNPIAYALSCSAPHYGHIKIIEKVKKGETFAYCDGFDDLFDCYWDGPFNACIKTLVRNGLDAEVKHAIKPLDETQFWMLNNERAKISLGWKKVQDAEEYEIYRKDEEFKGYKLIATVSKDTLSYNDTGLTIGNKYSYKIIAVAGERVGSSKKKTLTATIQSPWIKKLNNSKKGQIEIECSKVEGATKYAVYRMMPNKTYKYVGMTTNTKTRKILDKGLKNGATYSYKIRAIDRNGVYSAFSAAKTVTVK